MPFPDGDFLVWLDALLLEVRGTESKCGFDRISMEVIHSRQIEALVREYVRRDYGLEWK